jgi:Fe-S-cluster-containing dehydrogenase component
MSKKNINRREFLKMTAVGVAVAAGTRAVTSTKASSEAPKGKHQWAMVIDQSKCTGCGYCTLACQAHNDINPDIQWNKVVPDGMVGDMQVFVPRPVKASYYRDDGIVMMDYDRCIGCRYCQVACPYEARSFNWEKFTGENPAVPEWGNPEVKRRPRGVPEKCSFCYQRIDRGLSLGLQPGADADASPACVVICPTGARMFGDLNDPETNVSRLLHENASYRLRENLGTGPRVYYLPAVPERKEG